MHKIRVRVKGRLLCPMMTENVIFEISNYDETRGEVSLRRLFDPSGILLTKANTSGNKMIRGSWLEKHYLILS